jgi:glycosyltransferase involved in cell wall biosynthesis
LYQTASWLAFWHLDWFPAAFVRGLTAGRRRGVKLVWATAPHVRNLSLGYALARALDRPLVVDLRDPWTYGSLWQPVSPLAETVELAWARTILDEAALAVFASPLTHREMESRFAVLRGKSTTIPNGFSAEDAAIEPRRGGFDGTCLLRHVGVMNDRRTPGVLLRALELAIEREPALGSSIHLELVGDLGGNEAALARASAACRVSARGPVSRCESLALMRGADVNVLLQTVVAGTDVIAGKTFEYLAAGRPILAVVDPRGGDAWLLRDTPGAFVVPYTDPTAVADAIVALHARWKAGTLPHIAADLAAYDRRNLTGRLAAEFDRILR